MGKTSSLKQIAKFSSYGIWMIVSSCYLKPASAQGFDPLTPEDTKPKQPAPLPPPDNLNVIPTPPAPESVLDIPGTISVKQFEFAGNTVFSPAELETAIAEFTNRPVSFAQLVEAANQITQLYVERGYITTGAYIPEQSLQSDTVKIQIVEGSLADIEVDVEGKLKSKYVQNRLTSKISTPLNIDHRLQISLTVASAKSNYR